MGSNPTGLIFVALMSCSHIHISAHVNFNLVMFKSFTILLPLFKSSFTHDYCQFLLGLGLFLFCLFICHRRIYDSTACFVLYIKGSTSTQLCCLFSSLLIDQGIWFWNWHPSSKFLLRLRNKWKVAHAHVKCNLSRLILNCERLLLAAHVRECHIPSKTQFLLFFSRPVRRYLLRGEVIDEPDLTERLGSRSVFSKRGSMT